MLEPYANMKSLSILVVDDIPGYIEILELYLPPNMEIIKASSLQEATTEAMGRDFDLALVDVRLDEKDPQNQEGLDFLKWAREHRPDMPVIMISAYLEFEYEAESLASGARSFLHKPVNPQELSRAIEDALASRRD